MERVIVLFFAVLFLSGVFAAGEWGDVNVNDSGEVGGFENSSTSDSGSGQVASDNVGQAVSSEDVTFFTSNFYFALFVVLVALAIIGLFVWWWIRGPRNKWD